MQPSPSEVQALHAVRSAVRSVLDAGRGWEWPEGLSAEAFLVEARRQRVDLFLVDHELDVPDEVREPLVRTRDRHRLALLRQVHDYRLVSRALGDAGVRWMAFKGVPLAIQSAGRFTARSAGDIDLIVAPEDVPETHTALVGAGWQLEPGGRWVTPVESWVWRHARQTYYELPYHGIHSDIDLHWRLDASHHALPGFEQLWARRETLTIGGVSLATPSLRDAFRHSSTHAAKDSWHFLRSLVDVHLLAARADLWAGGHDWLRPVDVLTLRVVLDRLGLPAAVPPEVLHAVRSVPARRLREADAAVFAYGPRHTFPGATPLYMVRAMSRSSRHPADLLRLLAWVALPAHDLDGLQQLGATRAIGRGLSRRVSAATRRR